MRSYKDLTIYNLHEWKKMHTYQLIELGLIFLGPDALKEKESSFDKDPSFITINRLGHIYVFVGFYFVFIDQIHTNSEIININLHTMDSFKIN